MLSIFAIIALFITFTLAPIPVLTLKRMKFSQSTREEGSQSHMKKTGTPTMGGLTFLISIIITSMIAMFFTDHSDPIILLLSVIIGFGLIGFIDDYIIIVKENNQGLTGKQKFLAQIAIAIIFFILSDAFHLIEFLTSINIPFTNFGIPLSFAYVVFIVFWQVGFSNAVNLIDGLDGLATGLSIIGFTMYVIMSFMLNAPTIGTFCIIVIFALLGLLPYNLDPAKVLMGGTGSLVLGGILAIISIMLNQEFSLLFIGLVFAIETLSVMLQVSSYKLTKKRIFKMTPIHHHFELSGWSEWKVVSIFWSVGLISGLIGSWIGVH